MKADFSDFGTEIKTKAELHLEPDYRKMVQVLLSEELHKLETERLFNKFHAVRQMKRPIHSIWGE